MPIGLARERTSSSESGDFQRQRVGLSNKRCGGSFKSPEGTPKNKLIINHANTNKRTIKQASKKANTKTWPTFNRKLRSEICKDMFHLYNLKRVQKYRMSPNVGPTGRSGFPRAVHHVASRLTARWSSWCSACQASGKNARDSRDQGLGAHFCKIRSK